MTWRWLICVARRHDPDPESNLFRGTRKTMCRRCHAVIQRAAQ